MNHCEEQNIKCHKCRHILLHDVRLATLQKLPCDPNNCSSYNTKNFVHLIEDKLPDWMQEIVEKEEWTKGKLHCTKCTSKVGSFDFISGKKCDCGNSQLPTVHFISSQIDRPIATTELGILR